MTARPTIDATKNKAVLKTAATRNNGRYNGNGRNWETPPEVFGPLNEEFRFTVDVAANASNSKCARYYTEEQNGLLQDWTGERVWLQPPYGKEIPPWTRKARDSKALIVALLPCSCDLLWWHEDVVDRTKLRYLLGRPRFLTGGPYRASAFSPSVIVIWDNR